MTTDLDKVGLKGKLDGDNFRKQVKECNDFQKEEPVVFFSYMKEEKEVSEWLKIMKASEHRIVKT